MAPGGFEDEEPGEFEDDGVSLGGSADVGEGRQTWRRANGQEYVARYLGPYQDAAFVRFARTVGEHIILLGPPGTGKTALLDAAFAGDATSIPATDDEPAREHNGLYSIVCNVDTTDADFVGGYVQDAATGRFRWSPGPLMLALMDGVPLFVDEILLADPRVLSACLYPLMDGSGALRVAANPTLPPLRVPPGFFVIGAGNPDVPGANFSPALRSRFHHHIEVSTDWQLARKLRVPAWLVTIAKELDKEREDETVAWSPQLRELLAFRDQAERYGTAYAVNSLIGKAPGGEDRDLLIQYLNKAPETAGWKLHPLRLGGQKPGRA